MRPLCSFIWQADWGVVARLENLAGRQSARLRDPSFAARGTRRTSRKPEGLRYIVARYRPLALAIGHLGH